MISCAYLLGIQVSAGVLAVALTPSALPFLEETQIEQLKDAQEENNDICSSVDDVYKLCKEGQLKEAVDILYLMDQREGKRVHALMDKTGFMVDTFLVNHLVNITHGNIKLGKRAAERLFEMEPQSAATYVLLSNTYAAARRWDDMANVRKIMKDRGVKKEPGCSWIEVKNKLHTFVAGDRSHPQTEEINEMLEILAGKMKEAGYLPDISCLQQNEE
eukprot:Gb_02503 [translate_table: standard]